MSDQITVARVKQYTANVIHLFQQKGAKLRGLHRTESGTGKEYYFERLSPTAAVKRTVRHSDTPLVNSQHSRRKVTAVDFEWADLVDQQDKLRMIIQPESEYAINAAKALGRAFDDELIAAFDGSAWTGEDGTTEVTFANDYRTTRSGSAGDWDFSAAAVGTNNILDLKTDMDTGEVDDDGRFIVVSPEFLNQLLKNTTNPAASSDYNTIRALVRGDIDAWVGYIWKKSNRLPSPAANMRYGYAWHVSTMGVYMQKEISGRMDPRVDKSYSTQVYASGTWGATRVQGEGVLRFKINETN